MTGTSREENEWMDSTVGFIMSDAVGLTIWVKYDFFTLLTIIL